jgi:hypothetical protein
MWIAFVIGSALFGCIMASVILVALVRARARNREGRMELMALRSLVQARALNAILLSENAKLVSKGIDKGSLFLQAGHKTISEVTFGILQLFPATQDTAKIVREAHNNISDQLYGVFRSLNQKVGETVADKVGEDKALSVTPRKALRAKLKKKLSKKSRPAKRS